MKTKLVMLTLVSVFSLPPSALHAQGALTPPGAPAPVMKTLAQIEPRTPISALPYTITSAGSYYLTTNLVGLSGTNGITIACGNVTLDLEGFTLSGVAGSFNGVLVNGSYANLTVRNGNISGWGYSGVDAYNSLPHNVQLERLNVSANILMGIGASEGVVRDCCCMSNLTGIVIERGVISGCVAHDNSNYGIFADFGMVRESHARNNAGSGIYASFSTVSGCYASDNVKDGIIVYSPGCQIIGNICEGNNTGASGYAGIYIYGGNNRVEDNHVTATGSAGAGILVFNSSGYTNNVIVRNTVTGNGPNNFVLPVVQIVGPIITSTGTITNSNPWANFSY